MKMDLKLSPTQKVDFSISQCGQMTLTQKEPQQLATAIDKNNIITVGAEQQIYTLSFAVRTLSLTNIPQITEADKEVMNRFLNGGYINNNLLLKDSRGLPLLRCDTAGKDDILFLFFNPNGVGDNKIYAFTWNGTAISYFTEYELASLPKGTTGNVLTSTNYTRYLSIPEPQKEWQEASVEDLWGATELMICFYADNMSGSHWCNYFYFQYGMGEHTYENYLLNDSINSFYYDGSGLVFTWNIYPEPTYTIYVKR